GVGLTDRLPRIHLRPAALWPDRPVLRRRRAAREYAVPPMTGELVDPLRHNSWATRQLLAFCREFSPEQLQASSEGNYGTILATLQHLVGAESRYLFRLTGPKPDWPHEAEETEDLGELARMVEDMAGFWDRFAAEDFDA